jgi:hypothetical protein
VVNGENSGGDGTGGSMFPLWKKKGLTRTVEVKINIQRSCFSIEIRGRAQSCILRFENVGGEKAKRKFVERWNTIVYINNATVAVHDMRCRKFHVQEKM